MDGPGITLSQLHWSLFADVKFALQLHLIDFFHIFESWMSLSPEIIDLLVLLSNLTLDLHPHLLQLRLKSERLRLLVLQSPL